VAETVTGLLGIEKVQGLLEGPPEHDAPVTLQPENCQSAEGVAATEIDEPTPSEQPLGQFGETEPEPEATLVVKVIPGTGLTIRLNSAHKPLQKVRKLVRETMKAPSQLETGIGYEHR